MLSRTGMHYVATVALALSAGSQALAADDGVWSVRRSTGEVWVTTSGAAQVSLTQEDALKPGDTIRTGRNGRVQLVRGEETILISPNSAIGVPAEKKDGMSTTIRQQAGSILLEVEKRNVKHFEVETPYLAAVVKGTQFSVTVKANSTTVDVKRGQVEVSDFKSGQIALVLPGQTATSFEHGKPGLTLSGSGVFQPIEQGKPRASSIERIVVPKGGLPAPRNSADGKIIHALQPAASAGKLTNAQSGAAKPNVIRISNALGEVRLNIHKATHGLARSGAEAAGRVRNVSGALSSTDTTTTWSSGDSKPGVASAVADGPAGNGGNGGSNSGGNGNGNNANAAAGGATIKGAAANVVAGANGLVNGAVSNGKGGVNGVVGGAIGSGGGLSNGRR
jgi:FecR protein